MKKHRLLFLAIVLGSLFYFHLPPAYDLSSPRDDPSLRDVEDRSEYLLERTLESAPNLELPPAAASKAEDTIVFIPRDGVKRSITNMS